MLIPPILELYVVWHPDDPAGENVATTLLDHFHGTAFSGLVGGAVEVYTRSAGWQGPDSPPRPLPFMQALPGGLAAPAFTVVVPVFGTQLARAVEADPDDSGWHAYLGEVARRNSTDPRVAIFGVVADHGALAPATRLANLFGANQTLSHSNIGDASALSRDLVHSITGFVSGSAGKPLRVFVSHTKRNAASETADQVSDLVAHVRQVIGTTHMTHFFDEANLQPGTDWKAELIAAAESSAMLAIRTDLYASREWCQEEILVAKHADLPVVVLQALHAGEERGSFLMDHVPTEAINTTDSASERRSIESALNKLVDEALKRSLWRQQRARLSDYGFDWLPANAPEPTTFTHWLSNASEQLARSRTVYVLHPDPPLGKAESSVLSELAALAGLNDRVEILTPRTFASRGGQVRP